MMRYFCAGVLVLVFTSQALAQTPHRPSFGERIKSWFTFRKPEPAETIHPAPKMKPPVRIKYKQNMIKSAPSKSDRMQVTTRSGILRKPGPEGISALNEKSTPTFAPAERTVTSQAPRLLNPESAIKLPPPEPPVRRRSLRDTAIAPAAYEYESTPPKKSFFGWFKGLWKRDHEPPAPRMKIKRPLGAPAAAVPVQGSSSIDPRRVYRGSRNLTPSQSFSRDFSETGVPHSSSEFRGRKDSEF